MAVDFSAFDAKVNLNELQDEVKNAPEFSDVPDGHYIVGIDKMEIKTTKAGDKLMFAVQCNIISGADEDGNEVESNQKNRKIFFNRVITGNKNSENWNDGRAIKSVCTWVNELLDEGEQPVEFVNFSDFAEQILDVFQSIQGKIEVHIAYAAKDFNPISIKEVFNV